MPTLAEYIRDARHRLEGAGIPADEAALDADLLARHALGGWERGRLLASMRDEAPGTFPQAYERLVGRRARREPAAYIMGVREFWGLDIDVTPDTLIPRPETETLVEEALSRTSPGAIRIADVCTGSGCIAVALARWLPRARVIATDRSAAALLVARRNAIRHGVVDRLDCVRTDVLDGLVGPFDLVVSNPPYVPVPDLPAAQPEVRDFEPRLALEGDQDGLAVIRHLVPDAAARLRPGGWLIMEFGAGQAAAIAAVVAAEPRLRLDAVLDDLAGIPRVAVAQAFTRDVPHPMSPVPCPMPQG